jgi:1-acyl-sn-glycerol-3-phosphate acyltransferase
MLDFIINLDQQLFLFLNGLHCDWLDPLMCFASGKLSWALMYAGLLFCFFWKRPWKAGVLALLAVALTFALTDQVGGIIKHAVLRPRPCQAFEGLIYSLEACGGRYASFISNHAANIFGTAVLTALIFRKKYYTIGIYAWAALVAYSRIYVGKHYPLDLLGGAIVGAVLALLVFQLYKKLMLRRPPVRKKGILYTLLYYLYFAVTTPVIFLLGFVLMLLTFPFDRDRKILHYYSYFWGPQYYWAAPWWRLRVSGRENIDPKKTYIIMANHQSLLDICLLYKIPKFFKWVSKREVLRMPLVGWALWLRRDILITRDRTGLKKMLKEAQACLNRNISIVLFPEGTRTKDGRMHDFKEGGFLLAKATTTAILPVVIEGTFDVLQKNTWRMQRKQKFHLKILPEIPEEEVAASSAKEMRDKLHRIMLDVHKQMAPEKYDLSQVATL